MKEGHVVARGLEGPCDGTGHLRQRAAEVAVLKSCGDAYAHV